MSTAGIWLHRVAGLLLALTLFALVIGLTGHLLHVGFQPIEVNLRMLDNLRPHLLLMALLGALLLLRWGLGWCARILALTSLLGLVLIAVDYRARSAPSGSVGRPMNLLWMNLEKDNPIVAAALARAIQSTGADIVALAEATPAFAAKPLLADIYPYQVGCHSKDSCGLLVLSRYPLSGLDIADLPSGPERLARFTLALPGGQHPVIIVAHREKPWFVGLADRDDAWLRTVLTRTHNPPLIFIGDFNASPWSRRLWLLWQQHGFQHPAVPVATWPTTFGRFGVPIDHILVRGGVHIETIHPWVAEIGSNHRGLVTRLRLMPDQHPDN